MRTFTINPSGSSGRTALAAALLIGSALSGGCSTLATSDVELIEHDTRLRHPIMVSEEPEVLDIPVGMNGPALSPQVETKIQNYVAGYREHGTGAVTIQVPTASANAVAAASTGQAVHYALVRSGVPVGRIEVAPYHVGDYAKTASLRVSYLRVKAVAPQCGLWPETLPNTHRNSQPHNFGCAYQQNLAAMVANPADFILPQEMTPANTARRVDVVETFVKTGNVGWEPIPKKALIQSSVAGF